MEAFTRRQTLRSAGALLALSGAPYTTDLLSAPRRLEPSRITIDGWHEAVVVTNDIGSWIETFQTVGGWEIVLKRGPDASLNRLWSLPVAARTEEVLLRNVGTSSGFVRLVKVHEAVQRRIRPDDQAWETGGLQALDLRVVDLEDTRTALIARGWRAASDPVRYKTYGLEVIQWAPTSPDGVRLSFIQRISPALTGWPELKRWSRTTNAAITVRDMEDATRFFGDALGLRQASHSDTLGSGGHNVMGLPWRVAETTPVDIRGFIGSGSGGGAIELISLPQLQGRDYADAARPPNLGIAALRFIVPEVALLARSLEAIGNAVVGQPIMTRIAGYGDCKVLVAQSPDGVWLEFLEY